MFTTKCEFQFGGGTILGPGTLITVERGVFKELDMDEAGHINITTRDIRL